MGLRPTVRHGDHALAAGLRPAHGTTEATRHPRQQSLVGLQVDLGAEATADGGRDHANLIEFESVEAGQLATHAVGRLGGRVRDEAILVPRDGDGAGLERADCHALVDEVAGDHDLAAVEQVVGVPERDIEHGVGAELGMHEDLIGGRRAQIDHHIEGVVVDDDQFGGVLGGLRRFGQHHGHGFADESDHAVGQPRTGEGIGDHAGDGDTERAEITGGGDVGERVDGDHPRGLEGLGHVEFGDATAGDRGAHELGVHGAGEQRIAKVGGVGARSGEEGRILASLYPCSHHTHVRTPPR